MDSWCISPVVIPISASSPERSAFAQAPPRRPANMSALLTMMSPTGKYIRDNESEEMLI